MKKILLSLVAVFIVFQVFLGSNAKAQWVNIPDSNFVNWLKNNGFNSAMNGSLMDTTNSLITTTRSLTIRTNVFPNKSNIKGVQYFDSLNYLDCGHSIDTVPPLPPNLKVLIASGNPLNSLPTLPSGLKYLDINGINLQGGSLNNLPTLPTTLTYLNVSSCHFPLPSLQNISLDSLDCSYNLSLNSLPILPNSLQWLNCAGLGMFDSIINLPNSITYLNCSVNNLVYISNLPTSLINFNCYGNLLTSLPPLPSTLTSFDCVGNLLTSLPSLPISLPALYCGNNHLTSLPSLPNSLTYIDCDNNNLTALPTLPNLLTYLDCSFNQLGTLPPLPATLFNLVCKNNQLTSIPALPAICQGGQYGIDFTNNLLTSLPALPDSFRGELSCGYNPHLYCLPDLKIIRYLDITGTGITCLPSYGHLIQVNSSSTFPPLCGVFNSNSCGFYWNISGSVYADKDTSCTYNATDNGLQNVKVQLWRNGNIEQQVFTNVNGDYTFKVHTYDTFQIKVDTTGLPYFLSCPNQQVLTSIITASDSTDFNMNFAMRCKNVVNDVKAQSISAGHHRPGRTDYLTVDLSNSVGNNGYNCNTPLSGKIKLFKTGPAKFKAGNYYSLAPTLVSADSLIWNVSNFNSFINLEISVDTAAQIGQNVCYTLIAVPNLPDANPYNDTLNSCFPIFNSFDPNIKTVNPQGNLGIVDTLLTYTIQFQNTGTDTAINIVVKDTLNSNLDISTITVINSSFTPLVQTFGNVAVFNFPNIYLVDSTTNPPLSHGFVTFSIKRLLGSNGSPIPNKASIYFDLNPAVVTNTTNNIICNSPTTYSFNQSIYSGNYFVFNGDTLYSAGTYTDTLVNYVGCDSIVTLHLLLCTPISNNISQSICGSQTYYFHHQNLNTAGLYHDTLTNVNGCDSIINLTLNVVTTIRDSFTQTICSPQTFTFNSQTLSANGFYSDTLTSSGGCDSISTLHLIVKNPSSSSISATICSNDIYTLNSQTFSSAGIYNDTIPNYAGCDSVITLTLHVNNISATPITQTACDNYLFGGQTLTASGTYYDTLTNYLNCDSLLVLTLTIHHSSSSIVYDTTCNNVPFVLNGKSFTTAGVHYDTLQNYMLCDSIITLNLYLKPIVITNLSQTICNGYVYVFNGNNLTTAGTYYDTLTAYNGCDSIVALSLAVNNPSASAVNGTLCNGNNFVFNSKTYTSAGTYYDTLQNYVLCDSIITITVINGSNSASAFNHTTCSNNPYYFHHQFLNVSNNYNDTIPNYLGCDSVITLTLNVLQISGSAYTDSICGNQYYTFHNQNLNIGGTYYDTLQNYLLCDSIITLTLKVNPISNYAFTQDICSSSFYTFNGNNLNTTGFYKDTLQNYHLCDSIITLHLIVHQPDTTNLIQHICRGGSYSFNNQSLTTTGVYWDTLSTSWLGCDSFIVLHLFVDTATYASINHTICSNNFYHFHHQNLNQAGTYYDTLLNYNNCDSIVTLTLSILPTSGTIIPQSTCANQPFVFNGQSLTTAGTYYDTLQNYLGCDSLITLQLSIIPTSSYSYNDTICDNHPLLFNNHLLQASGTYYDTLQNYLGCDSLITLHLIAHTSGTFIFSAGVCNGSTYNFQGLSLTTAGTYTVNYINQFGCDSIFVLHLHQVNSSGSSFTQTICGGQSYNFNGHNLINPGTYYDTLTNYMGCDSLITLHLQAGSSSFSNITQTICNGSSYTFHNQQLTASGIYYDTLINSSGCNTLVTLNLTVINNSSSTISQTICNGQSYNFFGQHLFATGFYTHHFTNYLGCDSSVILNLTVNKPNVNVTEVDTILTAQAIGSTYQWATCHGNQQNIYQPIAGSTSASFTADSTGWYAVIVTTNGCIDTSVCYFVNRPPLNTGIGALNSSNIKVYPNPTDNLLHIQWQPEEHLQKIILQDAIGKMVKEIYPINNNETLSIKDLPQGIYFLHLLGNKEKVLKVIKE